jgi:hypothetical protein
LLLATLQFLKDYESHQPGRKIGQISETGGLLYAFGPHSSNLARKEKENNVVVCDS